jgi:predicted nucleic acid-binding protein
VNPDGALVILDNTVLTNLAVVGDMDLVFRLWGTRVCSTQAVMDEYHRAVAIGLLPPNAWADLPMLSLDQAEMAFAGEV